MLVKIIMKCSEFKQLMKGIAKRQLEIVHHYLY